MNATRFPLPAPLRAARSTRPAALAAALAAALLGGCASGPEATWSDPQLAAGASGARPLQGARVLVVCEAAETTLRQLCLDRMAEELTARGLTPVRSAQSPSASVGRGAEAYVGEARAAGAQALLLTSVTPDTARAAAPRSPFSIGIGGFSFGGHSGAGVGVSVPIGGAAGSSYSPGYAANGSFTEVGSGRLLWSARTSTGGSDLNAGMGTMAKTLMGAAEKAGVF